MPSLTAKVVSTGSPTGPSALTRAGVNPAASAAATVPSPPSATGTSAMSRLGAIRRSPAASAAAAWAAVALPLNLSGATTHAHAATR